MDRLNHSIIDTAQETTEKKTYILPDRSTPGPKVMEWQSMLQEAGRSVEETGSWLESRRNGSEDMVEN